MWKLNYPIHCLLMLWALSVFDILLWMASTWPSSCWFLDLLCCLTDFKARKRFYYPTSCLPMSVWKVSCPSRTVLTNEAKLNQRHPGCTNWAEDLFQPSSFQEQVLVRKYFEIFPVQWIFCLPCWICIYALLKMKIFQWFGAYKVWAVS